MLVAHRKSYDDHINLVGWRDNDGREELRQWQIEDDTFIPRVDMPGKERSELLTKVFGTLSFAFLAPAHVACRFRHR